MQEEITAINLVKYRKVQHDLEESEERADQAENAASKQRAKAHGSVSQSKAAPVGILNYDIWQANVSTSVQFLTVSYIKVGRIKQLKPGANVDSFYNKNMQF